MFEYVAHLVKLDRELDFGSAAGLIIKRIMLGSLRLCDQVDGMIDAG